MTIEVFLHVYDSSRFSSKFSYDFWDSPVSSVFGGGGLPYDLSTLMSPRKVIVFFSLFNFFRLFVFVCFFVCVFCFFPCCKDGSNYFQALSMSELRSDISVSFPSLLGKPWYISSFPHSYLYLRGWNLVQGSQEISSQFNSNSQVQVSRFSLSVLCSTSSSSSIPLTKQASHSFVPSINIIACPVPTTVLGAVLQQWTKQTKASALVGFTFQWRRHVMHFIF